MIVVGPYINDDTSTTASSDGSPSSDDVEDDYNTASSDEASSQPSDDIEDGSSCNWLEQEEEEFEGYSTVEILHQLKALERDRFWSAITGQISDYSFSTGAITDLGESATLGVAPTSAVHIIPPLTNENHEVGFKFLYDSGT